MDAQNSVLHLQAVAAQVDELQAQVKELKNHVADLEDSLKTTRLRAEAMKLESISLQAALAHKVCSWLCHLRPNNP